MSSIVYTVDHKGHKAGAVNKAVPFLEARDLVRQGIATYWNGGEKSAPPVDALALLREKHAAEVARIRQEHAAEINRLKADLDAATKLMGEKSGEKSAEKPKAK